MLNHRAVKIIFITALLFGMPAAFAGAAGVNFYGPVQFLPDGNGTPSGVSCTDGSILQASSPYAPYLNTVITECTNVDHCYCPAPPAGYVARAIGGGVVCDGSGNWTGFIKIQILGLDYIQARCGSMDPTGSPNFSPGRDYAPFILRVNCINVPSE